jgi:hypothetical protein
MLVGSYCNVAWCIHRHVFEVDAEACKCQVSIETVCVGVAIRQLQDVVEKELLTTVQQQ